MYDFILSCSFAILDYQVYSLPGTLHSLFLNEREKSIKVSEQVFITAHISIFLHFSPFSLTIRITSKYKVNLLQSFLIDIVLSIVFSVCSLVVLAFPPGIIETTANVQYFSILAEVTRHCLGVLCHCMKPFGDGELLTM